MIRLMSTKIFRNAILAAAIVLAGRPARADVAIEDFEDVADWSGLDAERLTIHAGLGAGRWHGHERTPTIKKVFSPALDLSRERMLFVWVWSAKANNAAITVVLDSEDRADAEGRDYYRTEFVVDWRGWKLLELRLEDFERARQPVGWQRINYISFHASGWGNTPQADTELLFDDLAFSTGAIAELQVEQGWQGAEFVYTYSVTLEDRLGRARRLGLTLEVGPGLPFRAAVANAVVSLAARGRQIAVATITVPASEITEAKRLVLQAALLVVQEDGVMRDAQSLAAAVPLAQREHPRVLLTRADFARIGAWADAHDWARAARDGVVAAAQGWPASFLKKYGLSQWALPPEGGQWVGWYVCPVHHVNLQYAPPLTHRCPVDGATYSGWPYDQVAYARMHTDLAQAARDQGLAWQLVGDRPSAEGAAQILLAYADAYALLPLHDKDGGAAKSGARVKAQTLDEAAWLVEVAWAYDLIADAGVLTASQRLHVEQHLLRAAAAVVARYPHGISNWQSWHNAAIGAAAFAMEDPVGIARAFRSASDGFDFQLRKSISADGVWYEGSWGYHFYALDALINLAEMGARAGLDPYGGPLGAKLRGMFEAPPGLALPDGTLPAFNDSRSLSLWSTARYYSEVGYQRYRDPSLTAFMRPSGRGRDALLWGAEEVPATPPLVTPSRVLPAAGFAVLRAGAGAEASCLALDFGPHGGSHGHLDKLGHVFYAKGGILGVDPGTQAYSVPSHKTWDRVTLAHNTVVVDEQSQVEATGALQRFVAAPALSMVTANAGPAYATASLTRTLVLSPEYVVDGYRVVATDGQAHQLDWIHHAPGTLSSPVALEAYGELPVAQGYQHLRDPRGALAAGAWQVSFDQSPEGKPYGSVWVNDKEVVASFALAREPAAEGRGSGRLAYDFSAAAGYVLYSMPTLEPIAERPTGVRLRVFGDGSGNRLGLRLYDATDERFLRDVGPIDWTGWKTLDLAAVETWRHHSGNADGVFDLPATRVAVELTAQAAGGRQGALYLDDLRLSYADAGDVSVADFEGEARGLRLSMLGQEGTTLVVGEAPGPDPLVALPFAMARRRAQETTFLSLLEPYGQAPVLTEFSSIESSATASDQALAVAVRGPSFDDRLLALGAGQGGSERSFGAAACDGVLCQLRRGPEGVQRVVLAEGRWLRDGARLLVRCSEALTALQLDWQATGTRLELLGEGPAGAELRVWGPQLARIVIGGAERPFTRDGDYVLLRLGPSEATAGRDAGTGERDAGPSLVADGGGQGDGALGPPAEPGGCGCSQAKGGDLAQACTLLASALGALLLRRRRRGRGRGPA
ncbi:MAG: alginate lyase family protein [Proteobacteria bacterium]|nr:alginate lyase family protein [Pseudomonadota bacterium]